MSYTPLGLGTIAQTTGIDTTVPLGGSTYSPGQSVPIVVTSPVEINHNPAESQGQIGNVPISRTVEGDLGTQGVDLNSYLLYQESVKDNASSLGAFFPNHRYRGHREGAKFNLSMQKVLGQCLTSYLDLKASNLVLETQESTRLYPLDEEISIIYHCSSQLLFKEWLLLKDSDIRWFKI